MVNLGAVSQVTRGIPIPGYYEDVIMCVDGALFRCPGVLARNLQAVLR